MPMVCSNFRLAIVGLGFFLAWSLPEEQHESCKGPEFDEGCPVLGSALLQNRMKPSLHLLQQEPPCGEANAIVINIPDSQVTANNLGGLGPVAGDEELLRFSGVATVGGSPIDLEITTGPGYSCNPTQDVTCQNNGRKGGSSGDGDFGQVNFGGEQQDFVFTFKNQETGEPVVVPRFHMTFLDFDGGVNMENILIPAGSWDGYYVSPDTELVVNEDDGILQVHSTQDGGLSDNPTDQNHLTALQKNRAIQVSFSEKSSFTITYQLIPTNGRTFLFGGFMDLGGCPPSANPCAQLVQIDFSNAELVANNLNGVGPESGDEEMIKFAGVGTVGGSSIDLEITSNEDYSCGNLGNNGKPSGNLGSIQSMGEEATFTFNFKNQETGEPVVLPRFYMTFFDFDGGVDRENLDVTEYDSYHVMPDTELVIEEEGGVLHSHSTTNGNQGDNPDDINQLTAQQAARSLMVGYTSKSSITVTYKQGPPFRGRTFLFAGCVGGFADACPCSGSP